MNFNTLQKNRFIRNFSKDKKLIITITFIILFWAVLYLTMFYKANYKSEAKIWIKNLSTDEFVTNLDSENQQLSPLSTIENPILTQIEILKSHQLSHFVVDYIRKNLPEITKKVGVKNLDDLQIDKIINTKNKVGTEILDITIKWDDPKQAQELLKAVLNEYDNINLGINKKIRTQRRKYIDEKLEEITSKLFSIRSKIKEYKESNLAIDLDEESQKLVDQKIDMVSKLDDAAASENSTKSSINELERKIGLDQDEAIKAVALGSGNTNLIELRKDLNDAIQQYQFDSVALADTNPKIIAQKNKIEEIKELIKNQVKLSLGKYAHNQNINIFDPVREKIVGDLVTSQTTYIELQAERKSLNSSISQINSLETKMPLKKYVLDNLQQEEKALSDAYDQLREKQIEAKIKEAETVSNVVVVDEPDFKNKVIFPKPTHIIILAMLLGLGMGFSSSMFKTYVEDICDDIEAIEEITGTSIIGTIPWFLSLMNDEKTQFILNVAYNNILSSLMIKCLKLNATVLTFTSTSLKKPQSPILYQLACRLKRLGHSVAVIDTDFRIPTIYIEADIANNMKVNLSDLIMFLESKIKKKQEINAKYILESMVRDSNGISHLGNNEIVFEPYEFFGSEAFETIVKTLKENFDWVLIDTSAAQISPEFLIISKLSNGIILFINKTIKYSMLIHICKIVKRLEIPIVGTIVREYGSNLEKEYEKYLHHQEKLVTYQKSIMDLEFLENEELPD